MKLYLKPMTILSFTTRRLVVIPFLVLTAGHACAQGPADVPFNGVVSDLMGNPLKGVVIWTKDERRYAKSDKSGKFGLTNVLASDTIHVKYRKVRYDIPVEGRKSARIRLANENTLVDEDQELVDIGYGYVKKRECTISRGGISGEELVKTGKTSILEALQGKVAGLTVTGGRVLIRGMSSLNASNEPLFLVDDAVVESLDMVSIYDVDYVEVLKDANIYGVRGANGVIKVKTKR